MASNTYLLSEVQKSVVANCHIDFTRHCRKSHASSATGPRIAQLHQHSPTFVCRLTCLSCSPGPGTLVRQRMAFAVGLRNLVNFLRLFSHSICILGAVHGSHA